ncbi:MAG: hypothetical protein ACXVZ4_06305 [Gaiellaceae bacterium]
MKKCVRFAGATPAGPSGGSFAVVAARVVSQRFVSPSRRNENP